MIHVVQQGECFSSIAARYGMKSWKELYEHPDNAELKKKRPNPNVLAPGDEVVLPEPHRKWEERTTEKRHRFVMPAGKVRLRIQLCDNRGNGCDGKRFVVSVGQRDIEGSTTAAGIVDVEVPATAAKARLRVWLGDEGIDAPPTVDRDLALGHLDPIDTLSGVQSRLRNLGYRCPVDGEDPSDVDDRTLAAVRAFREHYELPPVDPPEPPASDGDADEEDDEGEEERKNEDESENEVEREPEHKEEPDAGADERFARYVAALMDDTFRARLVSEYETQGDAR